MTRSSFVFAGQTVKKIHLSMHACKLGTPQYKHTNAVARLYLTIHLTPGRHFAMQTLHRKMGSSENTKGNMHVKAQNTHTFKFWNHENVQLSPVLNFTHICQGGLFPIRLRTVLHMCKQFQVKSRPGIGIKEAVAGRK